MNVVLSVLVTILEEGLIYGIMAMGVYITYSVLDFPDLSVDGTFPLGACVTACMINSGVNPWIACIVSFLAGSVAGSVTGFLHVKLKITGLLAGILTMTSLWTVNLVISNGTAIVPFYNKPNIFNSGLMKLLPDSIYKYRILIIAFVVVVVVNVLMNLYLKTKSGLILRGTGDNSQFVISNGIDPGKMQILGLAIGNGCTALAGSVIAQQGESANVNSGTGMVVMALASVIIGTSLLKGLKFIKPTVMVVLGSIIYKACLAIAMQLGLPTNYLKLLMAVIFTLALLSNGVLKKGGKAKHV